MVIGVTSQVLQGAGKGLGHVFRGIQGEGWVFGVANDNGLRLRALQGRGDVSAASPICSDFQTFCPDWLHFGHFLCFGGIAALQLSHRIFPIYFRYAGFDSAVHFP